MINNEIYIERDFGWFIGSFADNKIHKHYAIQLSIPLQDNIAIATPKATIETTDPVLIQSNIPHQILSDSRQFLLLLNPASTTGHFWRKMAKENIQPFNHEPALALQNILNDQQQDYKSKIKETILKYDCYCAAIVHKGDERIEHALQYLQDNFDRVVPLEETAEQCNISPSRFLHLFKEHTGITYRRAQLWVKLVEAMALIEKKSYTEIAHHSGFSDSAHFSRVFKENFGFGPREFSKISQFIQVYGDILSKICFIKNKT